MPDFELLEKHPWITVGAIAGGGFVLYLVLRGRSSGGSSDGQVAYAAGSTVDPSIAAGVQAQQDQIQGSLSGLAIQSQTQLALGQLSAGIQQQTISATQDVTNRQTDAQLQFGLGTLDAQVASQQISAGVQMRTIDAIVAAFRGNDPIANPTPTVSVPVSNAGGNPISGITPPQTVYVQPPYYDPGNGNFGGSPVYAGGSPLPGGAQLVPRPNYATCLPWDSACVANNNQMGVAFQNNVMTANTVNNRNQCLANAAMNAGKPNYQELVAACG